MDGINEQVEEVVPEVEAAEAVQRPSEEVPANATKADARSEDLRSAVPYLTEDSNLPTCYFLATAGTKSYEGDYHWVIELEKGWSPWMPGNEPFDGSTDQPLRYTLGRYDFEVHFENDARRRVVESTGIQTNLTTGKVRRIQRLQTLGAQTGQKGESVPAWEGTGTRRRVAKSSQGAPAGASLNSAPKTSAAQAAQANRAQRRQGASAAGYVPGGPHVKVAETQRPALSQAAAAYKPGTAPAAPAAAGDRHALPRYMRPLKLGYLHPCDIFPEGKGVICSEHHLLCPQFRQQTLSSGGWKLAVVAH
eukprot:s683_g15.t1